MLIKSKEAAAKLSICPKQLRKLVDEGLIPVVPCGKSSRGDRYDPADLQEFIKQNKQHRKKCLSVNAEIVGTSTSRSEVSALEKLLEKEQPGSRQKSAKQNSGPVLVAVN